MKNNNKKGHFGAVLSLTRHALYAAAALPLDHIEREMVRRQVERLENRLREDREFDRADKIADLRIWFESGAIVDGDSATISADEEQSKEIEKWKDQTSAL